MRTPELGPLQFLNCLIEIEQLPFGGDIEHAQRTGYPEAPLSRGANTVTIVNQQQISVQQLRECDRCGFAFVKPADGINALPSDDLQPVRTAGDPAPNRGRCSGMGELGLDSSRKKHFLKQSRQNIDVADQDQVTDWTGIGDNQSHSTQNPRSFSASRSCSKSAML